MHPETLRALAKARHEDLLTERRPRGQPAVRIHDRSPRFHGSRQRVGAVLIWAGARLVGDRRVAVELVPE